MTGHEIDDYLAALDPAPRATLEALRRSILAVIPDADPGLSYGQPAFRVRGKAVAGFAAFSGHLSYLPFSGTVLATLSDVVVGYDVSKGSLRFPVDRPLPDDLVRRLVETRLDELGFR